MKSALRLMLLAPLALTVACQSEAPAPQATASAEPTETSAAVATNAGISASNAKLILPAVKGRPGAAYFMLSNSGPKPVALSAVAIEGAGKAEMHETKNGQMVPLKSADVSPGDMLMFERGGKHVMVFDLAPTIKAGGTAQMTLSFSNGETISLPVAVEAAGGGGGMDHGPAH